MSPKSLLLLLSCLQAVSVFGQASYFQCRLDGILNLPQVKMLQNTGGYEIRSGKPLVGFKVGYAYFNQRNRGFSVGLQLARKQYVVYEERRQPTTLLMSSTTPRYYTYSLPLAFEYRGNPFLADGMSQYGKRFFSLSVGFRYYLDKK